MLDSLQEKLQRAHTDFIRIDGQTPASKRNEHVERFQSVDNVRVALLSITACSEGLTLTAADTVVFAEPNKHHIVSFSQALLFSIAHSSSSPCCKHFCQPIAFPLLKNTLHGIVSGMTCDCQMAVSSQSGRVQSVRTSCISY